MNFTELCTEVYALTNRPDLVSETELAVRQATLKMHTSDFYPRDVKTALLAFETENYLQDFDITCVDRFRANKMLRFWDPAGTDPITGLATGLAGKKLTRTEMDSMVDSFGVDKYDVYYLAGTQINVRAKAAFQYLLWAYYEYPQILPATQFNSWIADNHPYAIVFDAAALVFKTIGFDEQVSKYEKLNAEQVTLLKASNIIEEGY